MKEHQKEKKTFFIFILFHIKNEQKWKNQDNFSFCISRLNVMLCCFLLFDDIPILKYNKAKEATEMFFFIFIITFENKTHKNYLIMNKNEQKLFCKHLKAKKGEKIMFYIK